MMHGKKIVLALIAVTLLLGVATSSADASVETWPSCGEKVITTSGGDYTHSNFTFKNRLIRHILRIHIFLLLPFSTAGKYMKFTWNSTLDHQYNMVLSLMVKPLTNHSLQKRPPTLRTLKKDCDYTPECRTTDTYVYTLLGNYPCNLIAGDKSIPARSLIQTTLTRYVTSLIWNLSGMVSGSKIP